MRGRFAPIESCIPPLPKFLSQNARNPYICLSLKNSGRFAPSCRLLPLRCAAAAAALREPCPQNVWPLFPPLTTAVATVIRIQIGRNPYMIFSCSLRGRFAPVGSSIPPLPKFLSQSARNPYICLSLKNSGRFAPSRRLLPLRCRRRCRCRSVARTLR